MQSHYLLHRLLDFQNTGLEELANIPAAALAIGVRQNRPQGIAGREEIPMFPQTFQIQIQLSNSGVWPRRAIRRAWDNKTGVPA